MVRFAERRHPKVSWSVARKYCSMAWKLKQANPNRTTKHIDNNGNCRSDIISGERPSWRGKKKRDGLPFTCGILNIQLEEGRQSVSVRTGMDIFGVGEIGESQGFACVSKRNACGSSCFEFWILTAKSIVRGLNASHAMHNARLIFPPSSVTMIESRKVQSRLQTGFLPPCPRPQGKRYSRWTNVKSSPKSLLNFHQDYKTSHFAGNRCWTLTYPVLIRQHP